MNDEKNPREDAEAVTEEEVIASKNDEPIEVVESEGPLETEDLVAAERDAYRDTLQRLQADFENYRKRMMKQQQETAERANESLVTKLLGVLDTIDLAKAHDPNGSLEQVASALLDVLSKEGLERVKSVEQPFDPTLHEAVMHEPGEGEQKVTEELRAGYLWKGRVIRPAMVKVIG